MLKIKNLKASIGEVEILKRVDLEIKPGELHAVMGPNGSGKSTLCHVVMGNKDYKSEGTIFIDGEEIDMSWKYTIRDDTSGDQILFMAYYEFVDGEQTTTIGSDSCVAYSSSILGADADYAETIVAVTPTWCDPVEE